MVRKVLAVTWLLCSMSAAASIDPMAVSNAEQWLQTALSSPQNGSDAARVLEVTSALSALSSSGDRLPLRSELLASLDNTEWNNNDLYARSWLAGALGGDMPPARLIETFQEINSNYAGWGLSANYFPPQLDTALVMRVIDENNPDVLNGAFLDKAIDYLYDTQQADGSWLHAEGGKPSVMVTSQVALALFRFDENFSAREKTTIYLE